MAEVYPICDKCGAQDENVLCYEGYGVGIRLCKNTCDGDYKVKVKDEKDKIKKELQKYKDSLEA